MVIKPVVEQNDTLLGRIFDSSLQLLILISIITFSIETLPDLKKSILEALRLTEVAIVSIFTIEYFLRLYVAEKNSITYSAFNDLVCYLGECYWIEFRKLCEG